MEDMNRADRQLPSTTARAFRSVSSFLVAGNKKKDDLSAIVLWWEKRRLLYNLVLLAVGIYSITTYWDQFALYASDPADDGIFPGPMPIAYGIMANVCYTFGWMLESVIFIRLKRRKLPSGQPLFAIGLIFSVLLTLFPAWAAISNTNEMRRAHQTHWLN